MQDEVLFTISNRIKEIRQARKITTEKLAKSANVSKGLISQIENNRTVPSLPVLISILQALNVDLNEFFKDISYDKKDTKRIEFKKAAEYQTFEKEYAKGFSYHRIFTRTILNNTVDFVLFKLQKGARRKKMISTESFEFDYMIQGEVEYQIADETYLFKEGESMFLDSRIEHRVANIANTEAIMLVVYFFITGDAG